MKQPVFYRNFIAFSGILFVVLTACESRKTATITPPQEFNPVEEVQDKTAVKVDSASETPVTEMGEAPESKPAREPMPTAEELKHVSPDLEARRALNNDAMKATRMKPDAFIEYMKSRIPYYRGKGDLKAENDMVRIRITGEEMTIENIKGRQRFPMQ